ncbi:nickel-type superoxide dismutase maturation protease [Phaeacidiphilus oryzae]|uniref:nickel-type superoxide dismutase maturation protease n=1 Tax=Phaeacidiphilus oryzae TaxID=348818 RepID=UPI000690D7B9
MAAKRQAGDRGGEPGFLLEEPPEGGGRAPGLLGVVDVDGPSMAPTLAHGDRLVCWYGARVREGSVVVARHPLRQDLLLVKRAVERRIGGWWLLSDNSLVEGDSRDFGVVPEELVLGRVLCRLRPKTAWLAPPAFVERARWRRSLERIPGVARRLGLFRRVLPEN